MSSDVAMHNGNTRLTPHDNPETSEDTPEYELQRVRAIQKPSGHGKTYSLIYIRSSIESLGPGESKRKHTTRRLLFPWRLGSAGINVTDAVVCTYSSSSVFDETADRFSLENLSIHSHDQVHWVTVLDTGTILGAIARTPCSNP